MKTYTVEATKQIHYLTTITANNIEEAQAILDDLLMEEMEETSVQVYIGELIETKAAN